MDTAEAAGRIMRLFPLALALLCAAVGCFAFAPIVSAKHHRSARPILSWNLPHTANESVPIPFSWTGRHLGRNHRLVIQRPEGTAHTWRSIFRLPTNSGSADLPGLPLGRYRFRIADLSGGRVLGQKTLGVAVFGQVQFSTLFRGTEFESGGVYTTPTASFPYITWFEPGEFDAPNPAFAVEQNHCKAVHIAFVPSYPSLGIGHDKSTVTGTVTVVQESREPVSASVPYDGIGSLDAEIVPGQSWSVSTSYKGEFEPLIYLNGYAICDGTESFFS